MDADTWQAIGAMIAALVAVIALLVNIFYRINARLKKIEIDLYELRGLNIKVDAVCNNCVAHDKQFIKIENRLDSIQDDIKDIFKAIEPIERLIFAVEKLTERYADLSKLIAIVSDHELRLKLIEKQIEAF